MHSYRFKPQSVLFPGIWLSKNIVLMQNFRLKINPFFKDNWYTLIEFLTLVFDSTLWMNECLLQRCKRRETDYLANPQIGLICKSFGFLSCRQAPKFERQKKKISALNIYHLNIERLFLKTLYFFLKMGQSWPLFRLFLSFQHDTNQYKLIKA